MRHPRATDVVLSALIAVLICLALAPAVARMQRSSAEAKCQSNLRRWAQAMSAYLADNHLRYPTNRNTSGALAYQVPLSSDTPDPDCGFLRFQYGVNWVEALRPYVQTAAAKTGQDWRSFRRCPNASGTVTSANASMTYSMNYNIVEQPKAIIRDPARLMMFREMDKLVGSVLRPGNRSTDSTTMPISAFLVTGQDTSYSVAIYRSTNANRHGAGSYICFTDGHIKYFTNDYFPTAGSGSSAQSVCTWDPVDQRWYNAVNNSASSRAIAVTP